MGNIELNSLLFDLLKLYKLHGGNIEDFEKIEKQFASFYTLIENENFNEAERKLNKLEEILGKNNSNIFKARSILEFERTE